MLGGPIEAKAGDDKLDVNGAITGDKYTQKEIDESIQWKATPAQNRM